MKKSVYFLVSIFAIATLSAQAPKGCIELQTGQSYFSEIRQAKNIYFCVETRKLTVLSDTCSICFKDNDIMNTKLSAWIGLPLKKYEIGRYIDSRTKEAWIVHSISGSLQSCSTSARKSCLDRLSGPGPIK